MSISPYPQHKTLGRRHYKRARSRKRVFFVLAAFAVLFFAGAWEVYGLIRDLPSPERISERSLAESTKIFDRTGTVVLYEIHGEERRTVIPFSDIPDHIKQATITAEDINFTRHIGIDFRGIARALVKNVAAGDFSQGGSTITQQLVKNSILGPEKTIRRKIREQILALLLERAYSKDEILAFYLNQIPYGSNAYGIATAADFYFNKKPAELSLAQASTLAALPKAPTYYSPYGSHKDELLARKDWILDRMADAGFVPREDADRAKHDDITFAPPREAIRAPHFVQMVREELNKKYGERFVEDGGLKVITTLDWTLQDTAERIVREGAERNERLVAAFNAALVAVDPKQGDILAMVGSRDYGAHPLPAGCAPGVSCMFDPYVNIATAKRQPGSAFKPFVYATALKKGYTPETVVFDVPTEFNPLCNADGSSGPAIQDPKQCYHPQNYDNSFRGPVSLRQALAQSLNVPSVKVLYLAGIPESIHMAEQVGISTLTTPERYGLSLVLGGAEVTLLDLVSSYGVFAADGIRNPSSAILRVETNAGALLQEKKQASAPAMDTRIARVMNDILSDNEARVPVFNPQSSLFFPDRRVAAKTGTTQDFRDAWTVGYTPSLVVGVWVGNSNNAPMNQKGLSVMVAGPIWHQFMETALRERPPEDFIGPEKQEPTSPVLRGQYRSGETVRVDKISGKIATPYTPPDLVEERIIGPVRSLLTIINKDDPAGPAPDPNQPDPQLPHWQAAIDQWLATHPLAQPQIPQESDDVHTADRAPRISWLVAQNQSDAPALLRDIAVRVDATFPLREVSLFIDDALAQSKTSPILSPVILFGLTDPLSGVHRLRIAAYDAVGNRASAEKTVDVR